MKWLNEVDLAVWLQQSGQRAPFPYDASRFSRVKKIDGMQKSTWASSQKEISYRGIEPRPRAINSSE